jgi:hypothetical protein
MVSTQENILFLHGTAKRLQILRVQYVRPRNNLVASHYNNPVTEPVTALLNRSVPSVATTSLPILPQEYITRRGRRWRQRRGKLLLTFVFTIAIALLNHPSSSSSSSSSSSDKAQENILYSIYCISRLLLLLLLLLFVGWDWVPRYLLKSLGI